jgi:hypothetical protein
MSLCEDNIKMDDEIICDGVGWVRMAEDSVQSRSLVDTVMDFRLS